MSIIHDAYKKYYEDGVYIPIGDMVIGSLYICEALNFSVGRWSERGIFEHVTKNKGLMSVGWEKHYERGGTVRPLLKLKLDEEKEDEAK